MQLFSRDRERELVVVTKQNKHTHPNTHTLVCNKLMLKKRCNRFKTSPLTLYLSIIVLYWMSFLYIYYATEAKEEENRYKEDLR